MKMKSIFSLVVVFCVLLNGCSYMGLNTERKVFEDKSMVDKKIEKGKSVKTDILDLLGKPDAVWNRWFVSDKGEYYERWYYFFEKQYLKWSDLFGGELMGFSPDLEVVHIDIYFDENGIVQDYSVQNVERR